MSALPLKADMLSVSIDVRFVPKADISLGVTHQVRRLAAWTLQTQKKPGHARRTRAGFLGGLIRWRNATLPRFSPPASIYPRIKIGVPASQ